jgi:hypothetical protein
VAVDVKQAVAAAHAFVATLYERPTNLRLEEVTHEAGPYASLDWVVTLSFTLPDVDPPSESKLMREVMGGIERYPRHFKTITIDGNTGEAKGMKIRHLPDIH